MQRNCLNSLFSGRFEFDFRQIILKLIQLIDCQIVVKWMSLELSDDKSTLVRVMAWCRQAICRTIWHLLLTVFCPDKVKMMYQQHDVLMETVKMHCQKMYMMWNKVLWKKKQKKTSHYLSQCWPKSMSPSGITRPQYVNNNFSYRGSLMLIIHIVRTWH